MELRNRGRKHFQESILSAKNATKDATFRKLIGVCYIVRRKKVSTHVLTEYLVRSPDESVLKPRCKYTHTPVAKDSPYYCQKALIKYGFTAGVFRPLCHCFSIYSYPYMCVSGLLCSRLIKPCFEKQCTCVDKNRTDLKMKCLNLLQLYSDP